MKISRLPAVMNRFQLPAHSVMAAMVAIPTVQGKLGLKYGKHAHYFMNFQTSQGIRTTIHHRDVIGAGLRHFQAAASAEGLPATLSNCFSSRYHYGFNLLEQLMLMTVPHTVTPIGNGRFVVNLWSWFGCILVDCLAGTVNYHEIEDADQGWVLGSQQWFEPETGDVYAMTYSLRNSIRRINHPTQPVSFRIFKHRLGETGTEAVWSGELSDFMHDIILNQTRQFCVACELGMYLDENQEIIPNR